MTPREEIFQKLRKLLVSTFGIDPDQITMDARFSQMGFDSLETAQLALEIEDYMEITLPDDELKALSRVEDVVRYVEQTKAVIQ